MLKPAKAAARVVPGGVRDPLKMAEAIRARYGSRAVGINCDGERGCAISPPACSGCPGFGVRQIDVNAAGDQAFSREAAGLRWGLPWEAIGRLGNAAGAVCITRLGAFPPSG